jgi:hypothetical protein
MKKQPAVAAAARLASHQPRRQRQPAARGRRPPGAATSLAMLLAELGMGVVGLPLGTTYLAVMAVRNSYRAHMGRVGGNSVNYEQLTDQFVDTHTGIMTMWLHILLTPMHIFGWLSVLQASAGEHAAFVAALLYLCALYCFVPSREIVTNALVVSLCAGGAWGEWAPMGWGGADGIYWVGFSTCILLAHGLWRPTLLAKHGAEMSLSEYLAAGATLWALMLPIGFDAIERFAHTHPMMVRAMEQYGEPPSNWHLGGTNCYHLPPVRCRAAAFRWQRAGPVKC